jgi:sarcinarray family protein
MNFKKICLLSVLFLLISGCISNENIAQNNATNLDGETQPTSSENSVNYDTEFKVITIENWDEREATVNSDGNLIYKREGSYYSRNLETNEEKSVPAEFAVSVGGTKATDDIFIEDLSKNITCVDCQIYKHISYYGNGLAEVTDEKTGCLSIDGKKVVFLADGWDGYNKGLYKSLYYYDLESKKAHKLLSDGRIAEIVGWTSNNEIIFYESMMDVDFKSPATAELFYFNITEKRKYSIEGTELDWSFSISPDGSKALLIGVNTRIYDFMTKSATQVDIGVWSDSSKKLASLTDESLIIFNTEDGSKKTIKYIARENHMQRLVWYKDKVYIIVFAPLVSDSYKGGDTDYGTVTATFNGKNPTVRYLDMKKGDFAEIHVTVTSKINSSSVIITLIEPHTKTYTILEGPSKMDQYIYNNSVTAGWSKTYIWKVSPDGKETDVYAPIDVRVEFSNHEKDYMINNDGYRRNVYFTIANPYIVN